MKKKFLSILLALTMCLSLLPTAVLATEDHIHNGVAFEPIESESGLRTLFANGGDGYLVNNITLGTDGSLTLGAGKTVNLCLNGKVLNLNSQGDITVSAGTTLNLYDCDTETQYCFTVSSVEGTKGLWTLTDETTSNFVTGGVITGGNAQNGGGVSIAIGGTFIMNGGNIVGNTATENGGGVSNEGTFTMSGGTITGNTATKGGGVYASSIVDSGLVKLVGGTITKNTATSNGGGVYVKEEQCFAAGTPITMADGSREPIETLKIGDLVRVFDHENGEVSTAKLFDLWKYPEKHSDAVTLHFSNEINITVVYGHSFFDKAANKYVAVTKDNVNFYVGHEFYNVDDGRWETLIGYDFLDGEVDTYVITSEKHLNCVANGMLSNEDGLYTTLTNVFEYGNGLKIDEEKKADDLERYGLFGYEELQYVSREVYDILNLQYLNVAFGKGMITKDAFLSLEAYWAEVDPELLCGTTVQQCVDEAGETCFLATAKSVQNDSPASPGVYLGGTIKITGNKVDGVENNLYLPSGKYVTIGDGKSVEEGGNGVAVPDIEGDDKMNIGVTTASGTGAFTTNGTEGDAEYFFSDSSDYYVEHSDDKLKLATVADNDKYPVWVAGTQITAHNKDDVLHDGGSVKYDDETKTLTLNGATIAAGKNDSNLRGIRSNLPEEETLTVKLIGSNVIGRAADRTLDRPGYKDYAVSVGLYIEKEKVPAPKKANPDGSVLFVGDKNSSLTIYDYMAGIEAGDVSFGTDFKGALNVYDYGKSDNCAIKSYGDVTILGGTFDLASKKSNGIYAEDGNVTIENANVTVNAGKDGICAGDDESKITIENASVDVTAGTNEAEEESCAIRGGDDTTITIDNSKVTATAGKGGILCCGEIKISGDNSEVSATATGNHSSGNIVGIGATDGCKISITDNCTVKAKGSTYAVYAAAESKPALTIGTPDKKLEIKNAQMATDFGEEEFIFSSIPEGETEFGFEVEGTFWGILQAASAEDDGYVTIQPKQSAPSGGGSTPTVTVPVSGDKDSVKVTATVSGSNATIKNVTSEQLDKVGTGENVTIDLSSLSKSVSGVTIPKTTFENVAKSDADGLEVKLPNGTTAVFDSTTVAAVAEQAAGSNIQLVVDKENKAEQALTAAQKETVKALNDALVLDAYFVSNGKRISDFKGGEAELTVSYPTTKPVRVWYVAEDGTKELVPSTFDGKAAKFVVTHFSHYAIEILDGSSYAACPQDNTCVYAKFTDANTAAWYHDGVHYCVENGMMNGVGNTQFAPNGTLTRGMVVTMLWRMEGEPVVNYAMTFKDVKADQWYTEAIRWAQSTGVVDGYSADSFGPDDNVTREQLAAILYNYAQSKGIDTAKFTENTNTLSHTDVFTISEWANAGMHFCIAAGVIVGDNGMLYPQNTATRAQAASMMQRFCETVLEK